MDFNSWFAEAKRLNPDYSDAEIRAEYEKTNGPAPAQPRPDEESWVAEAKKLNPQYSEQEIRSEYSKAFPEPKSEPTEGKDTDRTWGEVASDTGTALARGFNMMVGGAGHYIGLAGEALGVEGAMDNPWAKAAREVDAEIQKRGYSEGMKAHQAAAQKEIDAIPDDEVAAKIWQSIKTTASDPVLASNMVVEQLPMLYSLGKFAKAFEAFGSLLGLGAVGASRMAEGGVIAAGAGLQGADVGADAYTRLLEIPDNQWDANPEFVALAKEIGREKAKQKIAADITGKVTAGAAAISVAAQFLPGGRSIEKALAGRTAAGGLVKGFVKGSLGEGVSEGVEEGFGQVAANIGQRAVDPSASLTAGVGQAAGQGAVLGAALGGPASAVGGMVEGARVAEEEARKKAEDAMRRVQGAQTVEEMQTAVLDGLATPDPSTLPTALPAPDTVLSEGVVPGEAGPVPGMTPVMVAGAEGVRPARATDMAGLPEQQALGAQFASPEGASTLAGVMNRQEAAAGAPEMGTNVPDTGTIAPGATQGAPNAQQPAGTTEGSFRSFLNRLGNFQVERTDVAAQAASLVPFSAQVNSQIADAIAKAKAAGKQPPALTPDFEATIAPHEVVKNGSKAVGIGKMFGLNVVFFRQKGGGSTINGAVSADAGQRTIYINAAAASPVMQVFGHELTHWLERDSAAAGTPQVYTQFVESMKPFFPPKKLAEIEVRYGSLGNALNEGAADIAGSVWTNEGFWKSLSNENPSVFAKVAETVLRFIEAIKQKLGTTPIAKEVAGDIAQLEKLVAKYTAIHQRMVESGAVEKGMQRRAEQQRSAENAQRYAERQQEEPAADERAREMAGEAMQAAQNQGVDLKNEQYGGPRISTQEVTHHSQVQNRTEDGKFAEGAVQLSTVSTKREQTENRGQTSDRPIRNESAANQELAAAADRGKQWKDAGGWQGGSNFSIAKESDFTRENIEGITSKDGWAILTAENPNNTEATDEENVKRTNELRQRLRDDGIKYITVRGRYSEGNRPEERSFIVFADKRTAMELGDEFGQESILTREGLVYRDGRVDEATGKVNVFDTVPENYYTRIVGEPWAFSVDINFSIEESAEEEADPDGLSKQTVMAAAKKIAAKLGYEPIREQNPKNMRTVINRLKKDIKAELARDRNAAEWYRENLKDALRQVASIYDEITRSDSARQAFIAALAITSNGTTIAQNVFAAMDLYTEYRKDPSAGLPVRGTGVRRVNMEKALSKFNELVQVLGPYDAAEFLATPFKAGDLNQMIGISGWPTEMEVYGSAIFGPKIGHGFFSNLSGRYDALTMDRWFFRTWGRVTGTLIRPTVKKNKATGIKEATEKLAEGQISSMDRQFAHDAMTQLVAELRQEGHNIDVAGAQAILWYHEKALYEQQGAVNEKAKPTDYATEVRAFIENHGLEPVAELGGRRDTGLESYEGQGTPADVPWDEPGVGGVDIPFSLPAESAVRPGREGSVAATGIHFGTERGLPALSGGRFGSGINGSERERLTYARDPRLLRRVYFYVHQAGAKFNVKRREAGLGGHVYRASLSNLYEPGVSPSIPRTPVYSNEQFQIVDQGETSNRWESAVLDAGYDGYLVRNPDIAVVLNKDVPVEYLGQLGQSPAIAFSLQSDQEAIDILNREFMADAPKGQRKFTLAKKSQQTVPQAVVDVMRDAFGVDVVQIGHGPQMFNGLYWGKAAPNVLYIDTRARYNPLQLLGHEFWHRAEYTHTELYLETSNALLGLIPESQMKRYSQEMRRIYTMQGLPLLSEEDVAREAVSDITGHLFTEPTLWEDLKKSNPTAAHNLAMAMLNFIRKLMAAVRKVISTGWMNYEGGLENLMQPGFVNDIRAAEETLKHALRQMEGVSLLPRAFEGNEDVTERAVSDQLEFSLAGPVVYKERAYGMDQAGLEQFLIYSRLVAGKSAEQRAPATEKLVDELMTRFNAATPIDAIVAASAEPAEQQQADELKKKWNEATRYAAWRKELRSLAENKTDKTPGFKGEARGTMTRLVTEMGLAPWQDTIPFFQWLGENKRLDLKKVTPDELAEIPGISFKTANFFVIHTREDPGDAVALDVHILRWLESLGHTGVPKQSPQTKSSYNKWKQVFLDEAKKRGLTPSELDMVAWLQGSGVAPDIQLSMAEWSPRELTAQGQTVLERLKRPLDTSQPPQVGDYVMTYDGRLGTVQRIDPVGDNEALQIKGAAEWFVVGKNAVAGVIGGVPRWRRGTQLSVADDAFAADMDAQAKFLSEYAVREGHESLDAWVAADPTAFARAAQEWRDSNPRIGFSLDGMIDEEIDMDDFALPVERPTMEVGIAQDLQEFRADRPLTDDDFRMIGDEWLKLAANPDNFTYPISFETDLSTIAYEMGGREVRVKSHPPSAEDARYYQGRRKIRRVHELLVGPTRRDKAWIYEFNDGTAALNVSLLKQGGTSGALVYQITSTWAANNDKVFIGDPAGLSKRALFRRTVNMFSGALRSGKTTHLEPHQNQLDAGLLWRNGDDSFNLGQMAVWIRDTLALYAPHSYDPNGFDATSPYRGAGAFVPAADVNPATAAGGARTRSQTAITDGILAGVVGVERDPRGGTGVRPSVRSLDPNNRGLVDGFLLSLPTAGQQYRDIERRAREQEEVDPRSVQQRDIQRAAADFDEFRRTYKPSEPYTGPMFLGSVPHALRMLGVEPAPLRVSGGVVEKALSTKHAPEFDRVDMHKVIEGLHTPAVIMQSPDGGYEIVTGVKDAFGNPVMWALHPNVPTQRGVDTTIVKTLFGARPGTLADRYGNREKPRKLLYVDDSKTGAMKPGDMAAFRRLRAASKGVLGPTALAQWIKNHYSGPESDMPSYSIAEPNRTDYTPEQEAFFKRVGRDTPVRTWKDRVAEIRKDFWKRLRQGAFDQFDPIKSLSETAYALARLSKGTAGAIEAFMKYGKLGIEDGVYTADMSGGFIERVGVALQGEIDDFLWWIAANRAEQLTKEEREHLFTASDIEAGKSLADGELKFDYTIQNGARAGQTTRSRQEAYADALVTFNEFNKNALDIAMQSGLIDREGREIWEREFYVPFYRVSEEEGFIGQRIKSGLTRQKAFQKLKGGDQKLHSDLLHNVLQNWSHLIDASAKNRAALATSEAAVAAGVAIEADAATVRQMGRSIQKRKDVYWVMDEGQARFFLVEDPAVMAAISALEYSGLRGPIMDAMSWAKRTLTVGVTASPAFKVRNLIRDSVQAIATSDLSYNPFANVVEGYRAGNRQSQSYVDALASGGLIRFGTMVEGSHSARVKQLIKQGMKGSHMLDSEGAVQRFWDTVLEPALMAYNELGNRGEEINRMALFNQLVKQGKSKAEAALLARDLMDFSMQGTWASIRFLTQVVPFMNARLQGLYKLGRSAQDNPKKMAHVLMAAAAVSIALLAAYHDDDDWKKREDWDRDNYWWFKFGGIAYRIPKPFEIGALATLAERGVELFTDPEMTGGRATKLTLKLLSDQLAMNPVPQAVKPIVDLYANKDSFTGRPIETMGMEKLRPDYRYNAQTSMAARAVSTAGQGILRATGMERMGAGFLSPVQIDHVFRGYFSWLGTFIVGMTDLPARPLSGEPSRRAPDWWKVGSQGFLSELPSGQSRYVTKVYDQLGIVEEAYNTHRNLMRQGRAAEANKFARENQQEIREYHRMASMRSTFSQINQQINIIERSALSPSEKKRRIDVLQQRKAAIAERTFRN